MKQKAVLVTGMAGFIGFHTAKRLAEVGETVVGFDNLNYYYDPKLKIARLGQLGFSDIYFAPFEIKI